MPESPYWNPHTETLPRGELDALRSRKLRDLLAWTFAEAPYGRWVLFAVAAGLLAYGAYCFAEARYKRI